MTDNKQPWEFTKIKPNSGLAAIQNQAFKTASIIAEQMDLTINTKWIDSIGKTMSSYQQIHALVPDLSAINLISESAERILKAWDFKSYHQQTLTLLSESLSSVSTSLVQHQIRELTWVTENLRNLSTLSLASSLQETAARLARVYDDSHFEDVIPEPVVTKEVDHEYFVKEAVKDQEEHGQVVPYNVLSMKFIINIYLPCLDIVHSLETVETVDSEFAVRFIMFNVLPIVYYFATKNKEAQKEKIDFDDDVVFIRNEENKRKQE